MRRTGTNRHCGLLSLLTVVLLLAGFSTARAQDTGAAVVEKSILTFSAPVELPRMTLPAGTYVFRRPDAKQQVRQGETRRILHSLLL